MTTSSLPSLNLSNFRLPALVLLGVALGLAGWFSFQLVKSDHVEEAHGRESALQVLSAAYPGRELGVLHADIDALTSTSDLTRVSELVVVGRIGSSGDVFESDSGGGPQTILSRDYDIQVDRVLKGDVAETLTLRVVLGYLQENTISVIDEPLPNRDSKYVFFLRPAFEEDAWVASAIPARFELRDGTAKAEASEEFAATFASADEDEFLGAVETAAIAKPGSVTQGELWIENNLYTTTDFAPREAGAIVNPAKEFSLQGNIQRIIIFTPGDARYIDDADALRKIESSLDADFKTEGFSMPQSEGQGPIVWVVPRSGAGMPDLHLQFDPEQGTVGTASSGVQLKLPSDVTAIFTEALK